MRGPDGQIPPAADLEIFFWQMLGSGMALNRELEAESSP